MFCISLVWISKHTTAGHLLEIMSTTAVRQVKIITIAVVTTFTLLFASTTEEKYPTLYSLAVVAERNNSCKQLQEEAKTVAMLFEKLFSNFAACHNHYSVAQKLSKDDISQLSKLIHRLEYKQAQSFMYVHWFSLTVDFNIQDSLAYYRESFPETSITPNMHMLEDHTIPWLEQWQCRLGFHGEQGLKSGHAEFNSLKVTYQNIRDQAEKLRHLLKEHHFRMCLLRCRAHCPLSSGKLCIRKQA